MISEAGKIPQMQENFKNRWKIFITVQAKINIANAGSVLINLVQVMAQLTRLTVTVVLDNFGNSFIFKFDVIA